MPLVQDRDTFPRSVPKNPGHLDSHPICKIYPIGTFSVV